MSIFALSEHLIGDYARYVRSFLAVSDARIRDLLERELFAQARLWPEPLLQLNPAYEPSVSVPDLCAQGLLHPDCANIFWDTDGKSPTQLYRHQHEAIALGLQRQPFVVTSGTGSGKTLTYFVPIFDAVLRNRPEDARVRAIIIYPMNALVNSQMDALQALAEGYERRTGRTLPVHFAKYTGQEGQDKKAEIQKYPPHILLTNYVMLELMLVRPEERTFVDRTTANVEFLVLDELHSYRGRQGADVAMLLRRLRERCGNLEMTCIGTSATMVAGKGMGAPERRAAVASFASSIFGVQVPPDHVIEERLQRITAAPEMPPAAALRAALERPLPEGGDQLRASPLGTWIELTYGIEREPDGNLRRRTPITLELGAAQLAGTTGLSEQDCAEKLRAMLPRGGAHFAPKLHHFLSQGSSVYATLQPPEQRYLTLEGQYYAPASLPAGEVIPEPQSAGGKPHCAEPSILYPLAFCRLCGQDYYSVVYDETNGRLLPGEARSVGQEEAQGLAGYVMVPSEATHTWSPDQDNLPAEWFDARGRMKRDYSNCVPRALWVLPDGRCAPEAASGGVQVWFQRWPFMLCLNCGESYTRRMSDFRKLARLSSEGRSTATTILTTSAYLNAPGGGIQAPARKLLSFTDNRQDASLQAGHLNDFVQVSLLRAAIVGALREHAELKYDSVADVVMLAMGMDLRDVARNALLQPATPQAREVWQTFRDLLEYHIYEDLRRGWRVVQPNLEQCGLLRITYRGLDELCQRDALWKELEPLRKRVPDERRRIVAAVLDHLRRKLAINVPSLQDRPQEQVRKRAVQLLNEQWAFEDQERLREAPRFVLPAEAASGVPGWSLAERGLVGRFLRRTLEFSTEEYLAFIPRLVDLLCQQGLLFREPLTQGVQLEGSALIWRPGDGNPPDADPIYSRRASGEVYAAPDHRANEFFRAFYQDTARHLKGVEGREHTAQVRYEDRQDREARFREGKLSFLFCSPTMELGIDIRDLQIVHMRNVPPTPANYAQRSGRAGRAQNQALVATYCAAQSAHDQYFFRHRDQMVAGAVRAPRLDLTNEDLVSAHVHALWLAHVGISLHSSIQELLEPEIEGLPLKDEVRAALQLSETRLTACRQEAERVLWSCGLQTGSGGWHSAEWMDALLRRAPQAFDAALERWRELYRAAQRDWDLAERILRHPTRDRELRTNAERRVREAKRQVELLCNVGTSFEESDFYPYRYLASEGFLPGYNFPRLPVRALIARGEGQFISRPRFLALTEFGPQNTVYHEGAQYEVGSFIVPPGGLAQRRSQAKLCGRCGYYNHDDKADRCESCDCILDGANSRLASLLEMPNVRTFRRQRITCDEEERRRRGFEIGTHFRFAHESGGGLRRSTASVAWADGTSLLHLDYAPSATLVRVNHGWRSAKDRGFLVDLTTGTWRGAEDSANAAQVGPPPTTVPVRVDLVVQDTQNLLLVHVDATELREDEGWLATLQYALKRGIESTYQVEESELASERVGEGEDLAILFWEAAEGGVGVLRRLVDERDALAGVARAALERLHFDPDTLADSADECSRACYECLLSYRNQRDHALLDRARVRDFLQQLSQSSTLLESEGRSYEQQYAWLRERTDARSDLERRFLDVLHRTKRPLPDGAQEPLQDVACVPDFFYPPNVCVFCDGPPHDQPAQAEEDRRTRQELEQRGYRVVVIRYNRELEQQLRAFPDVFGEAQPA